jgi:hypothetical protein
MTVYRIQLINGRFDHVSGKMAAVKRAIEMTGAPELSCADDLKREWGVTITPVTQATARSVGMGQ